MNKYSERIKKEIEWCQSNRGMKDKEYENGFLMGLNQALALIEMDEEPKC